MGGVLGQGEMQSTRPVSPTEAGSYFDNITGGFRSEKPSSTDLHVEVVSFLFLFPRATQDRWVIEESSEKTWSTGEGNDKQFSILALRTP